MFSLPIDRAMQINEGRFLLNGSCGYVLQPKCMRHPNYDPYDKTTLKDVQPVTISVTIIGARHLVKSGRGIASPFVEVEVLGCSYDGNNKYKTGTIREYLISDRFQLTIILQTITDSTPCGTKHASLTS